MRHPQARRRLILAAALVAVAATATVVAVASAHTASTSATIQVGLIGKYARAATKGKTVTIAMLDEHAGSSVGALRHNGFLSGFGIKGSDAQIACVGNGEGQTAPSQTAMENCLQKNDAIDVVYTINEPSAAGAWTALQKAGKQKSGGTIVSGDGGCAGGREGRAAGIGAPSQP